MYALDVVSCARLNNKLYFKAYQNCPGSFVFDEGNGVLEVLNENEPYEWKKNDYFRTISAQECIIFLPYLGEYFTIFDSTNEKFIYIKKQNRDDLFRCAAAFGNKVYAIPNKSVDKIIVIDIDMMTISTPFSELKGSKIVTYSNVCSYGDTIYLCLDKKSAIGMLNIKNNTYSEIELMNINMKCGTIIKHRDFFYISGNEDYIVKWDGTNDYKKIELKKDYKECNRSIPWNQFFSDCLIIDEYIYYAPLSYRCVVRVNTNNDEIEYIMPLKNENITWGAITCKNAVYMDFVSVNGQFVGHFKINTDGTYEENTLFEFTSNINLVKYGREYSEYALELFIDSLKDEI